ncbi:MAG TPA: hypothetical protein VJU59_14835, partial [Paraburkholderia sp.]|nr:hypothetical protein [Paraburkholderia sp.]
RRAPPVRVALRYQDAHSQPAQPRQPQRLRPDRAPQGRRAGKAKAFRACLNRHYGACFPPAARPVHPPSRPATSSKPWRLALKSG